MSATRLQLAIDNGLFELPAGRILVWRPPIEMDLSPLPRGQCVVTHGFRPAFDRLRADGWDVATEAEGRFDLAIVFLPREKAAARDAIARASTVSDGPVVIDGLKSEGVESILRDVRGRADVAGPLSKAHGKIFRVDGGDFSDWVAEPASVDGFLAPPGAFSADGPDPGSVALARTVPPLWGSVGDLGAGWGYLSRAILASSKVDELFAVEAERAAADCAKANLDDPRARVVWADAMEWRPPRPLDHVVMNPPFHHGRKPDPSIGRGFITASAAMLGQRGQLWMVANRHLPYEDALRGSFKDVDEIAGDSGFKLIHASRPKTPMR